MAVAHLMQKLSKLEIILSVNKTETKELLYDAPNGIMTDKIKQEIKANKTEIVAYLYQQRIKQLNLPAPRKLALEKTLARNCPSQINKDRWESIQNQVHLWIDQDKDQLHKIISDGWRIQDIFGCHKSHPQTRIDYMGLLMLIHGKSITQVNMGAIRLRLTSGAEQCFYKNILTRAENGLIYSIEDTPEDNILRQSLNEDERMEFEERAAIMEYDGRLLRSEAETQSLKQYFR